MWGVGDPETLEPTQPDFVCCVCPGASGDQRTTLDVVLQALCTYFSGSVSLWDGAYQVVLTGWPGSPRNPRLCFPITEFRNIHLQTWDYIYHLV